jgi:hypothetical protein
MAARRIEVDPDSEIAELLQQAREQPIIVEFEGQRFRLGRDRAERGENSSLSSGIHEPEGGYDADRFAEILSQVAGSISLEDGERMKAHIYAARKAGSRPVDD